MTTPYVFYHPFPFYRYYLHRRHRGYLVNNFDKVLPHVTLPLSPLFVVSPNYIKHLLIYKAFCPLIHSKNQEDEGCS